VAYLSELLEDTAASQREWELERRAMAHHITALAQQLDDGGGCSMRVYNMNLSESPLPLYRRARLPQLLV
jgi:hypothetical protein